MHYYFTSLYRRKNTAPPEPITALSNRCNGPKIHVVVEIEVSNHILSCFSSFIGSFESSSRLGAFSGIRGHWEIIAHIGKSTPGMLTCILLTLHTEISQNQ